MLNREEIFSYIKGKYGAEPEYLWARTPNSAILRHKHNRKWFAAVVDVTEDKLGLPGKKAIDALLLKCGPMMNSSLIDGKEIFRGYHMNKEHWITVHLGSSIPAEKVHAMIDMSFDLTQKENK